MKWLRKVLLKRRQDDRVKIIIIFALTGIVMSANSLYRTIKLYGIVDNKAEYVIAENESVKIKDYAIDKLKDTGEVITMSRQIESSLSIYSGEEPVYLDCIALSDEYLAAVYGVDINSSMRVFYINKKAYDLLAKDEKFKSAFADSPGGITVDYSVADNEEKYKGKLVVLNSKIPDDRPYAFYRLDRQSLKSNSTGVRICYSKDDIMGEIKNNLIKNGYTVSNSDVIDSRNNQYEMELLRIKYSIMVAGLCFLFVMCIKIKYPLNMKD